MDTDACAVGAPRPGDALVLVDLQNDFVAGGALAVPGGDEVVAGLNAWAAAFAATGLPVVATRDWHPPDHCSFQARGGPWPAHCVAGTPGARFVPGLALPRGALIVDKGTAPDREAYSGFAGTDLAASLRAAQACRVWVGGLATDYCVAATAREALRLGFEVVVLTDCVRGVDRAPGDSARALAALRADGATLCAGLPAERTG